MKLVILAVLCFSTLTQVANADCTIQTFDEKGVYLATVQTGDDKPLDSLEAAEIAELLNVRHNNGKNPVRAVMSCS